MALERRRNLELEGFTNDIAMLRRTIATLEGQWAVLGESLMHSTLSSTTFVGTSRSGLSKSLHASSSADTSALNASRQRGVGSAYGATDRRGGRPKSASGTARTPQARRVAHGGDGDAELDGDVGKVKWWPPAHHTHHGQRRGDAHAGDASEDMEAEDARRRKPSSAARQRDGVARATWSARDAAQPAGGDESDGDDSTELEVQRRGGGGGGSRAHRRERSSSRTRTHGSRHTHDADDDDTRDIELRQNTMAERLRRELDRFTSQLDAVKSRVAQAATAPTR